MTDGLSEAYEIKQWDVFTENNELLLENDQLKAENARLRKSVFTENNELLLENDRLKAENARLRKLVQDMLDYGEGAGTGMFIEWFYDRIREPWLDREEDDD